MNRKIASHFALINGSLERNIVVEVAEDGTIIDVHRVSNLDSCASVEFFPGILIPGMVNAHCHLELSYLHGAIAEGGGFATFAREIGRVRGNFSDEERRHAASVADARMWEEGVEAVADIANDELVMDIKDKSKIEYHTFFELFGLCNDNISTLQDTASRHNLSYATPHSTYSVQDTPFKRLCNSAPGISLHFLESDDETALYTHQGSLWEWYQRMGWECDFLHYGSPTERVVQSMPSDKRLLLVHGTRTTKEDVSRIDDHMADNATWVLCPESNRYISRLTPPIAMLRNMGANIAIGTDSLASARSLSMIENLRMLDNIPLNELLCYATINGAKALGIDDIKGSITQGKRPGLVVIEGVDMRNMSLTEESIAHRIL